jgi:REP element-mobilizing transposase RayT
MPRSPRTDFAGAWHHVMNRGAHRHEVFSATSDAVLFLDSLAEASARYEIEIHAYCLMGNHFHLLVQSRSGQLSECIRFAVGRFSRTKNKKDGSDGPLFRGRFTSRFVESEPHLVETSRYIHLNPVRAGLALMPQDWKWSSARAYLGLEPSPPWLITDEMLAMFGRLDSAAQYRDFLIDGMAMGNGVRPRGSDTGSEHEC